MAEFRCLVTTSTGLPIADAAIRVLTPLSADVTATLFGRSPVYTDATGLFSMPSAPVGSTTGVVPSGTYTIIAIAPGFLASQVETAQNFTGVGSFSLVLSIDTNPAGDDIVLPESLIVSPLYPVEVEVPAQAVVSRWEFIEAKVSSASGGESLLEVQTSAGLARLNLQARLELETGLHLVGDDEVGIIDPDFSDSFTVNLASLTASGRVELDTEFTLRVANVAPIGELNDLTNFTNLEGPADWMTPWEELPKFTGHYAMAMIWLPLTGLTGYSLRVVFQNINRSTIQTVTTTLDDDLFTSGQVAHIRIPEAIAGAYYALITILHGSAEQSKPLTVRYIHG